MTSNFLPSDRERDSGEGFAMGYSSGDGLFENPLADAESPGSSDRWIDEALRSVPLPEGFLRRMSRLAQSAHFEARAANPA